MPRVDWETFVAIAKSGQQVVSFPTDTVPALACRPDRAELIFALKQRSPEKPLILMGATAADLWPYVRGSAAELSIWRALAADYWPGALTLVLPASEHTPPELHPLTPETIGIRVPDAVIAREILAETGVLATTSANRSGEPALERFCDIEQQFPEVTLLAPEAWPGFSDPPAFAWQQPMGSGTASTVVQWETDHWNILRQGSVHLP